MNDTDYSDLAKILSIEDKLDPARNPLGWEWSDVSIHPSHLTRLITQGALKVEYKSNNHTYYKLTEKGRLLAVDIPSESSVVDAELPEVTTSIFGDIIGYDRVKELIATSLIVDKPVHILLYGPPALAKTMFLRALEQHGGSLAMWVSGSSTSLAGLWDKLAEVKPRWLLIDELEKMKLEDTASLLNLMENGRIVRTKSRRNLDLKINCWVIATANRIDVLAPELKSRFAKVEVAEYSQTNYITVVKNVVIKEGASEVDADLIAKAMLGRSRDVRDAVRVARLAKNVGVDKAINLLFP